MAEEKETYTLLSQMYVDNQWKTVLRHVDSEIMPCILQCVEFSNQHKGIAHRLKDEADDKVIFETIVQYPSSKGSELDLRLRKILIKNVPNINVEDRQSFNNVIEAMKEGGMLIAQPLMQWITGIKEAMEATHPDTRGTMYYEEIMEKVAKAEEYTAAFYVSKD